MLSSLAAVPNGMADFVTRRKRTFTWLAGTVGGAYLLGKWGIAQVGQVAERARRDNLDKDNLARRFDLNQQDCQFTVMALLPTLSTQIMQDMDVEACTAELSAAAAREKEKQRQVVLQQQEAEARQKRAEQEQREAAAKAERDALELRQKQERQAEEAARARAAQEQDKEKSQVETSAGEEQQQQQPSPNGDASPQDSSISSTASVTETPRELPVADDRLDSTLEAKVPEPEAPAVEDPAVPVLEDIVKSASATISHDDTALSKSWAQVVVDGKGEAGTESVANLAAPETESEPTAEPEPAQPQRSRAELWTDIKIWSFARTITSIYVLTLLAMQTHVQLNLLGRASYVTSVISNLPASGSASDLSMKDEQDLEMALYAEKLATQQVGVSKDTERKYLTFSWWLLHRGWRIVGDRVQSAVEDVVGSMGLKSTLVYGEISTLFSQIRQKIEFHEDGSLFDFSAALFPPTAQNERETLSSGGIPAESLGVAPVTAELRRLLNETSDCLDAPDCTLVRKLCLDRLFTHLVLSLEAPFRPTQTDFGAQGSRFEDVTERTARLASLLPSVARQSHVILNSMPNEYVQALEDVRELTEFSAIIYSSFDRDNVRGSC